MQNPRQYLYLTLLLTILAGCTRLLDAPAPQAVEAATALADEAGRQALLIGAYQRLQHPTLYGRDLIALPEALADNGRATNRTGRLNPEYFNQVGAHFTHWRLAYRGLNQVNLLLEAAPLVGQSPDDRNALTGQAHFLRALFYFDLVRAYAYAPGVTAAGQTPVGQERGGVPLLRTGVTDEVQITLPARAPVAEVYALIYSDLLAAIAELASPSASQGPRFATRAAAQALLARAALYNRDWPTAVRYATAALAGSPRLLADSAACVAGWRVASHPEAIFELAFAPNENPGQNFSLQATFTTLTAPGNRRVTAGFGDLVPTDALLRDLRAENDTLPRPSTGRVDSIVLRDARQRLYELGTSGRGPAQIECTKFLGKNGAPNLDNVPLLRTPELYLTRAEANYQLGNRTDALRDLNAVRVRCGLVARTDADLPDAALLAEVLRQRRLEFAFEGQRFFDLTRRGQDIIKAVPARPLPFADFRILAPLPTADVQANPNLRQNTGY